jgi:antitoxin component of MazEF toxin-antitoxin module
MNKKTVDFTNEIVKQGNSYCIRIPKGTMEYMGFELGDIVHVSLSEFKEEKIPKNLLDIYRKNIKELKILTDKELNSCFFEFAIENESSRELSKRERENFSKAFDRSLGLSKNKSFLKKYKLFKKVLTKENALKIREDLKKLEDFRECIEIQEKQKTEYNRKANE